MHKISKNEGGENVKGSMGTLEVAEQSIPRFKRSYTEKLVSSPANRYIDRIIKDIFGQNSQFVL